MDGKHFDSLVRDLARTSGSRRRFLAGGLAAVGAAIGITGQTDAAAKRAAGQICRKHGDCASGVCGPKDATGRRRCGCSTAADCPASPSDGTCNGPICTSGVCGVGLTAGGPCDDLNPCTTGDTCTNVQGAIVCIGRPVDCPPPDACHFGLCNSANGTCQPAGPGNELPNGTDCGGGNVCTGGVCGAVTCIGTFQDYGDDESAACVSSEECCQDEPTNCQEIGGCRAGPQCCHPEGGSCSSFCDCCDPFFCNDGTCGPQIG